VQGVRGQWKKMYQYQQNSGSQIQKNIIWGHLEIFESSYVNLKIQGVISEIGGIFLERSVFVRRKKDAAKDVTCDVATHAGHHRYLCQADALYIVPQRPYG
jgi:hypothetical protein